MDSVLKLLLYCIWKFSSYSVLISCSHLPVIFKMKYVKYSLVIKVPEKKPGQLGFISPFPADIWLTFSYTKHIFWCAFSSRCLQVAMDIYIYLIKTNQNKLFCAHGISSFYKIKMTEGHLWWTFKHFCNPWTGVGHKLDVMG